MGRPRLPTPVSAAVGKVTLAVAFLEMPLLSFDPVLTSESLFYFFKFYWGDICWSSYTGSGSHIKSFYYLSRFHFRAPEPAGSKGEAACLLLPAVGAGARSVCSPAASLLGSVSPCDGVSMLGPCCWLPASWNLGSCTLTTPVPPAPDWGGLCVLSEP